MCKWRKRLTWQFEFASELTCNLEPCLIHESVTLSGGSTIYAVYCINKIARLKSSQTARPLPRKINARTDKEIHGFSKVNRWS